MNRPDSPGQPIAFANKLVSAGVVGNADTPVTGAIADRNAANKDWLILGDTNRIHTVQDHAKLKLAFDFSSGLRASYTLGVWTNDASAKSAPTCAMRQAMRFTAAALVRRSTSAGVTTR